MFKKTIISLASAVVLASTPVLGETFGNYDSNSDGKISKDEFYGSVADTGTYSDWDTDGDGLINGTEFAALGYDWDYDVWDVDNNNYVDAGEFYDGYYTAYDADEDGHWQDGEWDDAGEAGLFDW